MIATRLHAKRLSSAVPQRPSVSSTNIHLPASQQHRPTHSRLLDDIQTIDSDHNIENDDEHHHPIDESTKVERILIQFDNDSILSEIYEQVY